MPDETEEKKNGLTDVDRTMIAQLKTQALIVAIARAGGSIEISDIEMKFAGQTVLYMNVDKENEKITFRIMKAEVAPEFPVDQNGGGFVQ